MIADCFSILPAITMMPHWWWFHYWYCHYAIIITPCYWYAAMFHYVIFIFFFILLAIDITHIFFRHCHYYYINITRHYYYISLRFSGYFRRYHWLLVAFIIFWYCYIIFTLLIFIDIFFITQSLLSYWPLHIHNISSQIRYTLIQLPISWPLLSLPIADIVFRLFHWGRLGQINIRPLIISYVLSLRHWLSLPAEGHCHCWLIIIPAFAIASVIDASAALAAIIIDTFRRDAFHWCSLLYYASYYATLPLAEMPLLLRWCFSLLFHYAVLLILRFLLHASFRHIRR